MLNGIDISNHQAGLDLNNVMFDFCIIKATDGNRFIDKIFDSYAQQVLDMGKLLGFYHFANNPKNGGSAEEQARYFVNAASKYFNRGIPVLDWEDSDWKYGGEVLSLGPDFALAWLREVHRLTGVRPWIYMSKSVCNEYDWSEVAAEGYALWGAQYATMEYLDGYLSEPWQDSNPWGAWGHSIPIFQYGSGFPVGSPVPLDLDLFYGDSSAWMYYASSDGTHANQDEALNLNPSADDVINVAESYIGCNESDGSFEQIIDLYNTINPLPAGYELQYSDEWCDGFVSAVAWKAGAYDLIGAECSVERHIEIFQEKGIWIPYSTITPKRGDIICFDWNNDGMSDHIGYVVSVEGDSITCIEGNKSQTVGYRVINVAWGYVSGYARPLYGSATTNPSGESEGLKKPENVSNGGCLVVDGYAGCNTILDAQNILGTYADGVVSGQLVANRIYFRNLTSVTFEGNGSPFVKALQSLIGAEVDGYWGIETSKCFQRYLVEHGYNIDIDGYFGPMSVMAWQRCINDGMFGK